MKDIAQDIDQIRKVLRLPHLWYSISAEKRKAIRDAIHRGDETHLQIAWTHQVDHQMVRRRQRRLIRLTQPPMEEFSLSFRMPRNQYSTPVPLLVLLANGYSQGHIAVQNDIPIEELRVCLSIDFLRALEARPTRADPASVGRAMRWALGIPPEINPPLLFEGLWRWGLTIRTIATIIGVTNDECVRVLAPAHNLSSLAGRLHDLRRLF